MDFLLNILLGFEYDYQFMINEIVSNIKAACKRSKVPMPNIFTEFGSYTVGESMAHIYSVIGEKMQNDREIWYMIDSSFITTLPDTWGIGEKFLMLPINKWDEEYQRVTLVVLPATAMTIMIQKNILMKCFFLN